MPFDFTLKRTWFAPGDKRRLDKIRTVSGLRLRAGTHRNMPDYLYPYIIGDKPGGPGGAVVLTHPEDVDAPEPENLAEAMGVGPFDGEDPPVDPNARDFETLARMEREADEQIKKNERAKAEAREASQPDDDEQPPKPTFEPPVEDDNPQAAAMREALAAEAAAEAEKPKPRRRVARKKG